MNVLGLLQFIFVLEIDKWR